MFRHAHLILAHLARHPQAKDKTNSAQLKDAERLVNQNLKTLDLLKPRINERNERYIRLSKEREARKAAQARESIPADVVGTGHQFKTERQPQRLQAHENKDLAVKIAQKEISRRAASRQAQPTSQKADGDDLFTRLQELRARLEPERDQQLQSYAQPNVSTRVSGYNYPSVPAQHDPSTLSSESYAKHVTNTNSIAALQPPSLPPKLSKAEHNLPPRPEKTTDRQTPRRTSTPEPSYMFAPTAYLENGTPLRTVFLPPTLRTTFLRLAYKNTLANLETCGFLAGTLIANAFFISRLIVPSQTATSDTCEMTNESELFDYVDSEDLMVLGWIHTHPSQTCFMSSRDLHTHAGYQMMLAESVAIVCAPSKGDTTHGGDWGVYRLTDPPGKKTILSCERPGIFHPHDVENIYTDALRPGHVVEAKGLDFEVVDLRHSAT